MGYTSVIFDLDGVICFTDEYHYRAWKAMADGLGIYFDRQINNRLRGVSRMESLEIILERYSGTLSEEEKQKLADKKNETYKASLSQMSPSDLSEDVRKTLAELRKRGYRLAIGSSSKNTAFILQQLGLSNFFDAVADGTCITHSKPHPEVFLKAAQMLGEAPENCLVVEDAVSGAKAGHAAGSRVACVGDASAAGCGEYNMNKLSDLLDILE